MNVGLLLLRLMLAALITGHACQKLFGWFRGGGPTGHGAIFEQWGFRPGPRMAVIAGVCELLGAGSISLGLLTPGGCAVLIGTMIVAASANVANGLWAHLGGCEVPVIYAGIAAVLALTGPGRFSLDHALGLHALNHLGWGGGAIVLGVLAAIPPIARRNRVLRSSSSAA